MAYLETLGQHAAARRPCGARHLRSRRAGEVQRAAGPAVQPRDPRPRRSAPATAWSGPWSAPTSLRRRRSSASRTRSSSERPDPARAAPGSRGTSPPQPVVAGISPDCRVSRSRRSVHQSRHRPEGHDGQGGADRRAGVGAEHRLPDEGEHRHDRGGDGHQGGLEAEHEHVRQPQGHAGGQSRDQPRAEGLHATRSEEEQPGDDQQERGGQRAARLPPRESAPARPTSRSRSSVCIAQPRRVSRAVPIHGSARPAPVPGSPTAAPPTEPPRRPPRSGPPRPRRGRRRAGASSPGASGPRPAATGGRSRRRAPRRAARKTAPIRPAPTPMSAWVVHGWLVLKPADDDGPGVEHAQGQHGGEAEEGHHERGAGEAPPAPADEPGDGGREQAQADGKAADVRDEGAQRVALLLATLPLLGHVDVAEDVHHLVTGDGRRPGGPPPCHRRSPRGPRT